MSNAVMIQHFTRGRATPRVPSSRHTQKHPHQLNHWPHFPASKKWWLATLIEGFGLIHLHLSFHNSHQNANVWAWETPVELVGLSSNFCPSLSDSNTPGHYWLIKLVFKRAITILLADQQLQAHYRDISVVSYDSPLLGCHMHDLWLPVWTRTMTIYCPAHHTCDLWLPTWTRTIHSTAHHTCDLWLPVWTRTIHCTAHHTCDLWLPVWTRTMTIYCPAHHTCDLWLPVWTRTMTIYCLAHHTCDLWLPVWTRTIHGPAHHIHDLWPYTAWSIIQVIWLPARTMTIHCLTQHNVIYDYLPGLWLYCLTHHNVIYDYLLGLWLSTAQPIIHVIYDYLPGSSYMWYMTTCLDYDYTAWPIIMWSMTTC